MGNKRNTWNNIQATAKAGDALLAETVQDINTHRNLQYIRMEALAHEVGKTIRGQSPGCKPRTYMHMIADRILYVLDNFPHIG